MKKLVFINQKGGVGKSTAAICFASWLHLNSRKVAIIDADRQRSVVSWHEWRGDRSSLDGIEVVSIDNDYEFDEALEVIDQDVDFVLIDTPGRDASIISAAIQISDVCIIPTKPTAFDIAASSPTRERIEAAGKPSFYLLSQAKTGSRSVEEAYEAFDRAGFQYLKNHLPDILSFGRSAGFGETPYSENRYQPGGIAIDKVMQEFLNHII